MFVDSLPLPTNAVPVAVTAGIPFYQMDMLEVTNHVFHSSLPPIKVWGYGGAYPGPTLQAEVHQAIQVRWANQLPKYYPCWLPIDFTAHGVTNCEVRTVVHLHGGRTPPEFDGHPTNNFLSGESRIYNYPNLDTHGATLWYHDHALGVTQVGVYAGLSGFYLLRNTPLEQTNHLPIGYPYEVPLLLQDRDFSTNTETGEVTLYFPPPASDIPCHSLPVVNGRIAPYLEVEPRKYRFRILNGSNFRTVDLGLSSGQSFLQIGGDAGFLPNPVRVGPREPVPTLRLMPAERADVIIDFSEFAGRTNIMLTNGFGCLASFSDAPPPLTQFMQFRVTHRTSVRDDLDISRLTLPPVPSAESMSRQSVLERIITLDVKGDRSANPDQANLVGDQIGGPFSYDSNVLALLNLKYFDEPATETPRLGDVETWTFVNLSTEPHPIHIHLIDFMVLERIPFDGQQTPPRDLGSLDEVDLSFGALRYIVDRRANMLQPLANYLDFAHRTPARANESGPKDVVFTDPQSITRVVMKWEGFPGPYVYHCHILDHEDNDMMRPMTVQSAVPAATILISSNLEDRQLRLEIGTTAGRRYQVRRSDNLKTWHTWTNGIGTGMTLYLSDHIENDHTRYYTVVEP